jgi:hypothetical protein
MLGSGAACASARLSNMLLTVKVLVGVYGGANTDTCCICCIAALYKLVVSIGRPATADWQDQQCSRVSRLSNNLIAITHVNCDDHASTTW